MTFELSWKLLKDFLEQEGFTVKTPRQVLKLAFQAEFITEGHVWIDVLNDRNLTVHTYEETIAIKVEQKIREEYFPILFDLRNYFLDQINDC